MITKPVMSLLCCASLVLPSAAIAQDTVADTDSAQIVVEGRKDLQRDIGSFVGAIAELPGTRQLSRFERAVCPVAFGLTNLQNKAIAIRMRKVAQSAGIRTDKDDCLANVVLMVTPDKQAFVKALRKKRPEYFAEMGNSQIRRMLAEPGPALAWQLAGAPVDARGNELTVDPELGTYVNDTTEPASRLTAAARPQFDAAVVIIESRAVEGLTPTQVADYAAMRTYAGTRPWKLEGSSAATILKILETPMGSTVPASLTNWDLGYLRGLYGTDNLYAGAHRGAIGREIAHQIDDAATR